MEAKFELFEPYHHFAALMFRAASDPASPLNPFHEASATVRREGEHLFETALVESDQKVPPDLRAELPPLLWTWSMGIVLYWIHDTSPARGKTLSLVRHSTDLVMRCIKLAANTLLRPLRKRVVAMLKDLGG